MRNSSVLLGKEPGGAWQCRSMGVRGTELPSSVFALDLVTAQRGYRASLNPPMATPLESGQAPGGTARHRAWPVTPRGGHT
jgi:hypothetical protein